MKAMSIKWDSQSSRYIPDKLVQLTSTSGICSCCGASYSTTQLRENHGSGYGIAIYEGVDMPSSEEQDGQIITTKVETRNGTFSVRVRTRWDK